MINTFKHNSSTNCRIPGISSALLSISLSFISQNEHVMRRSPRTANAAEPYGICIKFKCYFVFTSEFWIKMKIEFLFSVSKGKVLSFRNYEKRFCMPRASEFKWSCQNSRELREPILFSFFSSMRKKIRFVVASCDGNFIGIQSGKMFDCCRLGSPIG